MSESTTYAQMDAALRRLGFQKTEVNDGPVGYRHAPSDTVVLFKKHRPNEVVPPGTGAATRKLLIERGLVDGAQWDEMLRPVAA